MKERPETRLTIVFGGKRIFEKYNVTIVENVQDEGKTLKLFVGCSHKTKTKSKEKNPAHFCMGCNKYLGFKGFCSTKCHNKHYDGMGESS